MAKLSILTRFILALGLTLVVSVTLLTVSSIASQQSYPPMSEGNSTGTVCVRVMADNDQSMTFNATGINNVYVAIVNAGNTSIEYANGITSVSKYPNSQLSNNDGFYNFENVNSTSGESSYRIHAKMNGTDVYSNPFPVDSTCAVPITLVFSNNTSTPSPVPGTVVTPVTTVQPSVGATPGATVTQIANSSSSGAPTTANPAPGFEVLFTLLGISVILLVKNRFG